MEIARRTAALASAFLLAGCLKAEEDLVVYPDGAGRIRVTAAFDSALLGDQTIESSSLISQLEALEGFVAFTRPEIERREGWTTLRLTAYFESVDRVRVRDTRDGRSDVMIAVGWRKEGDGYRLEITDRTLAGGTEDLPPDDGHRRQIWTIFQPLLEGLEVRRKVTLPGTIRSIEGFGRSEGRTAGFELRGAELRKYEDFLALQREVRRSASCGPSLVTEAERQGFKRELEEAKAAWPGILEDLRRGLPK